MGTSRSGFATSPRFTLNCARTQNGRATRNDRSSGSEPATVIRAVKQIHGPQLASSGDAEDAYYAALARGDFNAVMALWADDDEVVCVHPGGTRLVGIRAIRNSYAQILSNGPLRIAVRELRIQPGVMVAVHSLVEQITIAGPRQPRVAQLIATNVYMKGPDGWRIVLHHASPGEAIEQADPAHGERPSGRLH